MGSKQAEREYEEQRLGQTISLATEQLNQARERAAKKKSEILEARQEARDDAAHSIANLYVSDDFEALVELSQYLNPITDKMVDYEERERSIRSLEQIVKSPYFARIDFQFDDEDEPEAIYIGRSSLKKNGSQEMYVYDWRSPVASIFYRFMKGKAFYDAPCGRITGELSLKRQYEINNGTLEYFFDTDVQIVDEFLRKLLSQNTSAKMKSIVETIQQEQDIVIRDMENDLLMVQGVAGSGKTSIALHRAAYLMYQGLQTKLSANNIMILSPNSTFEQYISDVLPELGENNVVSVVFDDLLHSLLKDRRIQSRTDFLEKLLVHSPYKEVLKNRIAFKMSGSFSEVLDRFLLDVPRRWLKFDDICDEGTCLVSRQTLRERIQKRPDVPLGIRLGQLEDYIWEQLREAGTKRKQKAETNELRQKIQNAVRVDVIELYKILFHNRDYFYSLLPDPQPSKGLQRIWEDTRENLETGCLSYEDAAAIAYLHVKIYGTNEYKNIRQVVIDEAQDYYPLQYKLFGLLFPNAKFTILGDMNQTLAKKEDLSLYEQIQSMLNRKKSSLVLLDKSFRCTNEILRFSLNFIEHRPQLKSFNRTGDRPEVFTADTSQDFLEQIVRETALCRQKGFQSIGLLCKTEANAARLFEKLKDRLELQFIRDESLSDFHGVFIMPVYLSKGLEFDAVLICDADSKNYYDKDDRNLLYVACTRALHRLNLFCEKEASPLIPALSIPPA